MGVTTFSGPVNSQAGFTYPGQMGSAGGYAQLVKQVTGIVENTATTLFTVTVPNINCGAGGRVLCTSTLTQASHIGDSTRTVEYIWSVTRLAGAVAVITISLITGASAIATKASGYTFTSVLAATAVSGSATAVNTFNIQVTNDASTDSTSAATVFAEVLNNMGTADPNYSPFTSAIGVTIA